MFARFTNINGDEIIDVCLNYACNVSVQSEIRGDGKFVIVPLYRNWSQANSTCSSIFGTTLATVSSDDENSALNYSYFLWIGYYQVDGSSPWQWAGGTINNYTNWYSDQPSSPHWEHCVEILTHKYFPYTTHDEWNDRSCDHNRPFACNYLSHYSTKTPTTNPTTPPTTLPSNNPTLFGVYTTPTPTSTSTSTSTSTTRDITTPITSINPTLVRNVNTSVNEQPKVTRFVEFSLKWLQNQAKRKSID